MVELIKNHHKFTGFAELNREHFRQIFTALKQLKTLRILDLDEHTLYNQLSKHF